MIGSLRGTVNLKSPPSLILEVNGVGYELEAPMTTFYNLPEIGQEVLLYTHLVVREDAHTLFGFFTTTDRVLFRSLIKVNGVGPKLALAILSGVTSDEFFRCVREHDTVALVRVPGIGKKTAERLIIEMQDRLPGNAGVSLSTSEGSADSRAEAPPSQEAISVLIALGYKPQEANRMVNKISDDNKTSEEIIRLALQSIGSTSSR